MCSVENHILGVFTAPLGAYLTNLNALTKYYTAVHSNQNALTIDESAIYYDIIQYDMYTRASVKSLLLPKKV